MTSPEHNSNTHAQDMFDSAKKAIASDRKRVIEEQARLQDIKDVVFEKPYALQRTAYNFIDQRRLLEPLLSRIWDLQTITIPSTPDQIEQIKPNGKFQDFLERKGLRSPKTRVIKGIPEKIKKVELPEASVFLPPTPDEVFSFFDEQYFNNLKEFFDTNIDTRDKISPEKIFSFYYWCIGRDFSHINIDPLFIPQFTFDNFLKTIPSLDTDNIDTDNIQREIYRISQSIHSKVENQRYGYVYQSNPNAKPNISFSCNIWSPSQYNVNMDNMNWYVSTIIEYNGQYLMEQTFPLTPNTTQQIGIELCKTMITSLHIDALDSGEDNFIS